MSATSSVDQAARQLLGSHHAENADDVSAVSDAKASGDCRRAWLGSAHYAAVDKMRLDGTLAELVDNAGDAGATRVDIDSRASSARPLRAPYYHWATRAR